MKKLTIKQVQTLHAANPGMAFAKSEGGLAAQFDAETGEYTPADGWEDRLKEITSEDGWETKLDEIERKIAASADRSEAAAKGIVDMGIHSLEEFILHMAAMFGAAVPNMVVASMIADPKVTSDLSEIKGAVRESVAALGVDADYPDMYADVASRVRWADTITVDEAIHEVAGG